MGLDQITTERLAYVCGITTAELQAIASNTAAHYKPPTLKRIGRKHRLIHAPMPEYKRLLKRVHKLLVRCNISHGSAFGGVAGCCHVDAAKLHRGSKYIVTRDVRKAFPSLKYEILKEGLAYLGFSAEISELLTRLMTVNGKVPHGSPISTDAMNIYLFRFDQTMQHHFGRRGLRYSRFVDDCIVSFPQNSRSRIAPEHAGKTIEEALAKFGLSTNEHKKDEIGFQDDQGDQCVHGLIVNAGPEVRVQNNIAKRWRVRAEKYKKAHCRPLILYRFFHNHLIFM